MFLSSHTTRIILIAAIQWFLASNVSAGFKFPLTLDDVFVEADGEIAYVIVDLFNWLPEVPEGIEAGESFLQQEVNLVAMKLMASDDYGGVDEITIEVLTVLDRDEYQQLDFSSAINHGTLVFIRGENGTEDNIRFDDSRLPDVIKAAREKQKQTIERGLVTAPPELVRQGRRGKQFARLMLFDELNFFEHPINLMNTYPYFEPSTLIRQNARFFERTQGLDGEAASGLHYGEIQLTASRGSIFYMPRGIDLNLANQISLWVKKESDASQVFVRLGSLSQARQLVYREPIQSPLVTGEWHKLSIPLPSPVVIEKANIPDTLKQDKDFGQAFNAIGGSDLGIEIGLEAAKPGSKLWIDRIEISTIQLSSPHPVVRGKLHYSTDSVLWLSVDGNADHEIEVTSNGEFEFELPKSTKFFDLRAYDGQRLFTPLQGRAFERSHNYPYLDVIARKPESVVYPISGPANGSTYIYSKPFGPRFRPDDSFVVAHPGRGNPLRLMLHNHSNAFGFLDKDRRFSNPDQIYRVGLLGDSYLMGLYQDQRDRIAQQTELMVKMRSSQKIEVIPAIHHHQPFLNGLLAFRQYLLKFKPSLVMINVVSPDILNFLDWDYMNYYFGSTSRHPMGARYRQDSNGLKVFLPDQDWRKYKQFPEGERLQQLQKEFASPLGWGRFLIEGDDMSLKARRTISLMVEVLKLYRAECAEVGCRILLAHSSEWGYRRASDLRTDEGIIQQSRFPVMLKNIASEAGVEFIDLSKDMFAHELDYNEMFIPGDGHWSALGHYLAAQVLSKYIMEELAGQQ